MLRYIINRLINLIWVICAISTLLFFLMRLSGDPVLLLVGEMAELDVIESMREHYGFNDPLYVQYIRFMKGALTLDFGESLKYRQPAREIVFGKLWPTLELALSAALIALVIAFPLGTVAAIRRGTAESTMIMLIAVLGQSMPIFWMGILLILLFSVRLNLLPSFGRGGLDHLVLPALSLGALLMAKTTRMVRSGVLEVLGQDHVRTAEAKGLSPRVVLTNHVLRNALIPVTTVVGLDFGRLLGGAVVTETIFSWPGLGRLLMTAVSERDYPLVQAIVFFVSIFVVGSNLLVDIAYAYLDPRIRYG